MKTILTLLLMCLGFTAQAQMIEPPHNLKPYRVGGMSREEAGFTGRYNFNDLLKAGYRDARNIPANKARVDALENLVDAGKLAKVKISYSSPSMMGYQFSGGTKITMGETVKFTGNWKYKPTAIPAGQVVYVYPDALGYECYAWQDGQLSDGTPTYTLIEYTWYKPVAHSVCGNPITRPNVVSRTHRFKVPISQKVREVPAAPVLIYVEEQTEVINNFYSPSRLYVGGTDSVNVGVTREVRAIGYFEFSYTKVGRIKCPTTKYCPGEPPVVPPPPPPPPGDDGTPPNNDENYPPPSSLSRRGVAMVPTPFGFPSAIPIRSSFWL